MSWQSWKRSTARRSIASSGSSSTAKTTIPRRCSMATRFSPTVVGRTTTLSRRPGRRFGRLQHRHALGAFAMTARANGGKVQHVMAPARLATSDGPRPMGFGQRQAAGLTGSHRFRHRPALAVTEGGCMAIDYDSLMSWRFPPVQHSLPKTDCIRYALGVGLVRDPPVTRQPRFVYEGGLTALPTEAGGLRREDVAAVGAALSPQRRFQPAPRRSGSGASGGLRSPDPTRSLHPRRRRSRAASNLL